MEWEGFDLKRGAVGLLVCCMCLLIFGSAYAADVTVANDRIQLTVTANPGEACLAAVVAADYKAADINKDQPEKLFYQGEFTAEADGNCLISFRMNPAAPTGDYLIRVRPKSGTILEIPFTYYSIAEKQAIVDEINQSEAPEIMALLSENRELLGLTLGADSQTDATGAFARIADAVKGGKQFTIDTLLEYYNESIILEAFAQNDKSFLLSDGMLTHDDITQFSKETGYALYSTEMSDAGIAAVHTALFGKDFADMNALRETFRMQTVLQGLLHNKESGYGHVASIISIYESVLKEDIGISFTDYDALSNQEAFHRSLLSETFNTPEGLRTAFENLAASLRRQQNETHTGGGGGGGSSGRGNGGSGSGVSSDFTVYPSGDVDQTDQPDDNLLFHDIADVTWAQDSIQMLAERGIVNGKADGVFAPHDAVTREEFIKMIVLALGFETAEVSADMPDVDANAWYAPYVAAAAAQGIVTGYEDGTFGVGRSITRQEMATIAYRAGIQAGKALAADATGSFADDAEISDYAKTPVYAMEQAGIINGIGGNMFAPTQQCTRAQAAKVIAALLNL